MLLAVIAECLSSFYSNLFEQSLDVSRHITVSKQ